MRSHSGPRRSMGRLLPGMCSFRGNRPFATKISLILGGEETPGGGGAPPPRSRASGRLVSPLAAALHNAVL